MSGGYRQYNTQEPSRIKPHIEERKPEVYDPFGHRGRTVIVRTTVHRRHRERVERSRSPARYRRRARSPSPQARLSTPPLLETTLNMSPRDSPALKPTFVPLPKTLPTKEEEEKAKKEKKSKDKIYIKSHKNHNSLDTGYGSGYSSSFSFEERSPLDYSPKSPKPRAADKVVYEVIDGQRSKVKYSPTRKDVRYVGGKLNSPRKEEDYVSQFPLQPSSPGNDKYKDRYKDVKKQTKVLQDVLAETSKTAKYNFEAAKQEEAVRLSQVTTLQEQMQAMRLSQQIAEGRAEEAEKKLKQQQMQQQIGQLERQERKQQERQADALEEREREVKRKTEELRRREKELARKQWDEIEASPSPSRPRRRLTNLLPVVVDQKEKPSGRTATTMTTYGQTTVAAQSPSILGQVNPMFLDPILEAQRDDDIRRAREAEERRGGVPIKERSRGSANKYASKPRRDDRYY